MRFAIFSDVHANRQAWEAVRADALHQRVGTLVCLGDVVGYGPKPLEVLASVRSATANFVLGNHDAAACGRMDPAIFNERARKVIEWTRERLDEESLQFLRQVPLQLDAPGMQFIHAEVVDPGEFGYIDGVGPAAPNLRAMKAPLAFIGHTHLPAVFTMPKNGGPVTQKPPADFEVERGQRYIVNVGSVGEPRTTDIRASYVIYDDEAQTVTFRKVAINVAGYVADLEETGLDIKPYFVRVAEATNRSNPPPTVGPQLAMSQLPEVSESVAGHHGSIVTERAPTLGSLGATPTVAGRSIGGVKQPRGTPAWLIITLVMLLLVGGATVLVFSMRDDGKPVAKNPPPAAPKPVEKKPLTDQTPKPVPQPVKSDWLDREVPIRELKVRVFAKSFESLAQLREADENGEATAERFVPDGLLSLAEGQGQDAYGLVWEGRLVVPEKGEFEFTLDSDDGSALLLHWADVVRVPGTGAMGRAKKGTTPLNRGQSTPFRLEYFQMSGEQGLQLTWSGPGLEGVQSLTRPETNEPSATGR